MKQKASVLHDESMARELRYNPEFAAEYLRAAMEDEAEPRVLLIALRRIAEARGLAQVAKTAGIERESLYRVLSPRGNPRFYPEPSRPFRSQFIGPPGHRRSFQ